MATPTSLDVVVDVRAAGVNNADLLQREGAYPVPAGASQVLGLECSGVISRVGSEVTDWSVGDPVCALLSGGGYAEQVVVPAAQLLPKPGSCTFVEAAALPEAACTVYANLAMKAALGSGMTLLVHGGTSGIGSFAIQWAKAIGARVITTAGTSAKVERVRELGADVAINYREENFLEATLEATEGRGVDVILDIVGAPYLDRNTRCLAPDGHLVIIGGDLSPGALDLASLFTRRASMSATTLRSRPARQKAEIVAAVRSHVLPLVEQGRIRPLVDTVLPMDRAAEAHRLLSEGRVMGKVVLTPPGG